MTYNTNMIRSALLNQIKPNEPNKIMTYSEALETVAAEISLYLASEEREDLIGPIQSIVLEIMSSSKCNFRVIDEEA